MFSSVPQLFPFFLRSTHLWSTTLLFTLLFNLSGTGQRMVWAVTPEVEQALETLSAQSGTAAATGVETSLGNNPEDSITWVAQSAAIQTLQTAAATDPSLIPEIIDPLGAALSHENTVVRIRAAQALGTLGKDAIPALLQALQSPSPLAQDQASSALMQMGTTAIPYLLDLWKQSDADVQSRLEEIFADLAQFLQYQTNSYYTASQMQEVKQWEAALAQIAAVIPPPPSLTKPDSNGVEANLPRLNTAGNPQSDRAVFYQSYRSLEQEIELYQQQQVTLWIVSSLGSLFFLLMLALWFRPQLILRLSRTLVQAQTNRAALDLQLQEVQEFFSHTGATLQRHNSRTLTLKAISNRLKAYTPLPILLATDQPSEADVTELTQLAQRLNPNLKSRAGILLYRESPDAIFRTEMAKVRMRDQFVLIPLPLVALEQANTNPSTASGLLAQYADRYLPGADLFDDRNAIGDTLSFFGRQDLLQRLEEELRRNQGIGLFGLRKSGKTSLLLQLGFALRHHPLVHLDLQPYGGKARSGTDLFNYLTQELLRLLQDKNPKTKLKFDPFPSGTPAAEVATTFVQQIGQLAPALIAAGYEAPILFFLDEVERILPTSTDPRERAEEFNAFFGALRSLSQDKRLISFLIADVHPDCNRINQWNQAGVATNPVFQFFKETFVSPLSEAETRQMLTDIGDFMGIRFDKATQGILYCESGGYPFVARQLASLLWNKVGTEGKNQITEAESQRYLRRPFTYSGVLKDYFAKNIWEDLEKREFTAAISILTLLTCNTDQQALTESQIFAKLAQTLTPSQGSDALLWLEAVGLVTQQLSESSEREGSEPEEAYSLRVPLLGHWLTLNLSQDEQDKWQLN